MRDTGEPMRTRRQTRQFSLGARWCRATTVVLVSIAMIAAGCMGGKWDEDAWTDAEEVITPIVIEVAKNTAAALPGKYKLIALVGVFAAEHVALQRAQDRAATYLLIDQEVDGEQVVTLFRIDTKRTLRVAMNGDFVTDIEQNLIRIWVNPEVDSTIVVTDAAVGDVVFIEGEFRLEPEGEKSGYDLDTASFGDPEADQAFAADADLGVGKIFVGTRNNARFADWTNDVPTLAGCASLPESEWRDGALIGSVRQNLQLGMPVFCIRTSDDRYGAITATWSGTYRYVLWANLDSSGVAAAEQATAR